MIVMYLSMPMYMECDFLILPNLLVICFLISECEALRRYEATEWLESLVGPLGISSQPSEREFISCLRSGLVLCNAINKIQPGSVQKVKTKKLCIYSIYVFRV